MKTYHLPIVSNEPRLKREREAEVRNGSYQPAAPSLESTDLDDFAVEAAGPRYPYSNVPILVSWNVSSGGVTELSIAGARELARQLLELAAAQDSNNNKTGE